MFSLSYYVILFVDLNSWSWNLWLTNGSSNHLPSIRPFLKSFRGRLPRWLCETKHLARQVSKPEHREETNVNIKKTHAERSPPARIRTQDPLAVRPYHCATVPTCTVSRWVRWRCWQRHVAGRGGVSGQGCNWKYSLMPVRRFTCAVDLVVKAT